MSKPNESAKLRWNSFGIAYIGLGFVAIMSAAGIMGMSKSPMWQYGASTHIALFAVGAALIILGFIADEVSYRRGDYRMPDLNQA